MGYPESYGSRERYIIKGHPTRGVTPRCEFRGLHIKGAAMTQTGSIPPDTFTACGNCGTTVPADAVMCPNPNCGVLLAAYAPATTAPVSASLTSATAYEPGTSATRGVPSIEVVPADTSETHETPTASMIEPAAAISIPDPAPAQTPASAIDAALRRSSATDLVTSALDQSASTADELGRMAADNSRLGKEIRAGMEGAKVTFSGTTPVITTDSEEIALGSAGADASRAARRQPRRVPAKAPTVGRDAQEPERNVPEPDPTPPLRRPTSAPGLPGWLPIAFIVFLFYTVGRGFSNLGPAVGLIVVIAMVVLLLRMAGTSSRKTTSMPQDDRRDGPRQ